MPPAEGKVFIIQPKELERKYENQRSDSEEEAGTNKHSRKEEESNRRMEKGIGID